jgi:DNA-binding MarR family transcriptional regulator
MAMKRSVAGKDKELVDLFIRVVNKYNALEKVPAGDAAEGGLRHSERHMLDTIAKRPELNITEHADALGVTKGAVSQVVTKLEAKGFITRLKKGGNGKAVYLELTKRGRNLAEKRKQINDDTLRPFFTELRKHSDERIDFLSAMFRWIDRFLDDSKRKMYGRARRK